MAMENPHFQLEIHSQMVNFPASHVCFRGLIAWPLFSAFLTTKSTHHLYGLASTLEAASTRTAKRTPGNIEAVTPCRKNEHRGSDTPQKETNMEIPSIFRCENVSFREGLFIIFGPLRKSRGNFWLIICRWRTDISGYRFGEALWCEISHKYDGPNCRNIFEDAPLPYPKLRNKAVLSRAKLSYLKTWLIPKLLNDHTISVTKQLLDCFHLRRSWHFWV